MSLLSELKANTGSTHYRKRVGRGIGSGLGGYSGKGGKGQTQRSGGSIRRGFEGGQTPLHRRLPKFGFTNGAFKKSYNIVNLNTISQINGNEINPKMLKELGIISSGLVKILGAGDLKSVKSIHAHAFSKSAKEAIEKAGGKATIIPE